MKKAVLLGLVFVLVSISLAAQPFQTAEDANHLIILYPHGETHKQYEDIELHFHVLNSTGNILNSSNHEVDCRIHVYNETNNHILVTDLTDDNEDLAVHVDTNKTIRYTYNLWCNSTNEYGYIAGFYEVTIYGKNEPEDNKFLIGVLIMLPIILGIFLLVGAATLGEEHNTIRIFLFLLSPAFIWASIHFGMIGIIRYYDIPELQIAIGDTVYWAVIVWGVLITYFIIYGLYKMIHTAAQKKKQELEY